MLKMELARPRAASQNRRIYQSGPMAGRLQKRQWLLLTVEWKNRFKCHYIYHLKCANARFACAILCVSSRFLIAFP